MLINITFNLFKK